MHLLSAFRTKRKRQERWTAGRASGVFPGSSSCPFSTRWTSSSWTGTFWRKRTPTWLSSGTRWATSTAAASKTSSFPKSTTSFGCNGSQVVGKFKLYFCRWTSSLNTKWISIFMFNFFLYQKLKHFFNLQVWRNEKNNEVIL